jgi:hypothetical protein
MILKNEPKQPSPAEWEFVKELAKPASRNFVWQRKQTVSGAVDLSKGIQIQRNFPDTACRLDTAYDDLANFFGEGGIDIDGNYPIIIEQIETDCFESYQIDVTDKCCRIQANDTEGIRRGIYYLEDLLLAADGPFLKTGVIRRKPWLKSRISRCFFGPIKRPPFNRDELADEVDYYPDEYLNRLAHEGVNGLWLTIAFSDLCKTSITDLPHGAMKRLSKLRKTVEKCLRYGIKTYIFCIEPRSMSVDSPLLQSHPELKGAKAWNGEFCFCTSSDTARKYIYESVNWIFSQVPDLGGMINISFGERVTTCLSSHFGVDCPVCTQKSSGDIIAAALEPMERGMHDAAPDAELISWLYVPQNGTGFSCEEQMLDIADKLPENVILQYNFESSGGKEQLGKYRHAGDYWLSYVGPSGIFENIAKTARAHKHDVSAKIQAGCSHEVATVPFVPVPGLLYRKYKAMREMGISHVMQCWYFGNYPGLMNKAAGELAFEDFKDSEEDFLLRLAKPDWKKNAGNVVKSWSLFSEGYGNYPLDNMFQYYGPMHDGVVWPLHLKPVNEPLAPTWRLDYGTSGDRYGECLGSFRLDEVLALTSELSSKWQEGVDTLVGLRPEFVNDISRIKDIGITEVLGILFCSGFNVLKFYSLRNTLLNENPVEWINALNQMEAIVKGEIERSARMIKLCELDSSLGFHSEAEGYKFFSEKLKWRIGLLEELLANDFEEIRQRIEAGKEPFEDNKWKTYICNSGKIEHAGDFAWRADYEKGKLKISVCDADKGAAEKFLVFLEPKPFHPSECFTLKDENSIELPFPSDSSSAMFNIVKEAKKNGESKYSGWENFLPSKLRLNLGVYNPHSMGKLIINGDRIKTKPENVL